MKLDLFDIKFEPPQTCYLAGSLVAGSVIVNASQSVKLRRISVRFRGEAKTSWVNQTSDEIYDSHIEVLDMFQDLTGYLSEISDGELLPEGVHSLSFKFQLPSNLPSTYYHQHYGWVQYTCIGSVEVAQDSCLALITGSVEQKVDKPVTVHSLVNKDIQAALKVPYQKSDSVELTGCFGSQGTVGASLNLSETCFLPGETIVVDVHLANKTKKKFKHCPVLSLCQTVHFRAGSIYHRDQKELVQVIAMVGVEPPEQGMEFIGSVSLGVPDGTLPSTLSAANDNSSDIITISYYLKLDLDMFQLVAPVLICSCGKKSITNV